MFFSTKRLRVALFSDPSCNLEFSNPKHSAIVRAFQQSFGSSVSFKYVDADDVCSGDAFAWQPHVFILPGIKGEISPFPDRLGDAANSHIRAFMEQGGLFFGICAGAYYGASHIIYHPEWSERRERQDGILALDKILAFGPVKGYCAPGGKFGDTTAPQGLNCVDAVPVIICDTGIDRRNTKLAYGLGPMFDVAAADRKNIDVLLRYDITGTPPAIVHVKNIGQGSAVLSGVLPQYAQGHKPQKGNLSNRVFNLLDDLYTEREGQDFVWNRQLMPLVAQHWRKQQSKAAPV